MFFVFSLSSSTVYFETAGKPNDRTVLLGEPSLMNRSAVPPASYVNDHRDAYHQAFAPGPRSEPFTDPYLQTDP